VIGVLVQQSGQGTGPTVLRQQEWIFELEADKEGIDRANEAIDHQLQQGRVDSVIVTIDKQQLELQEPTVSR
jgi:hypothetical protein